MRFGHLVPHIPLIAELSQKCLSFLQRSLLSILHGLPPELDSLLKSQEFIGENEQNAHLEFHSALWHPPLGVYSWAKHRSGIWGEPARSGHVPKGCSFPGVPAESEAVIQRRKGQQEPSAPPPGRTSWSISSSTPFPIFSMLEKSHETGDVWAAVLAG